ncbi:MAG: transglutaminase family protein [Bryobacteraceae bacterium]|jgi:transglutaminase-like putative cysteine protease
MILRAHHTTRYMYSEPVSICHTEVHLAPRAAPGQTVLEHHLEVSPAPDLVLPRKDYFGNSITYFSIHEPHQTLSVTASSLIDLHGAEPPEPCLTAAWETAIHAVGLHDTPEAYEAFQFTFESPRVSLGAEFAAYAAVSFPAGRPILEGALDLCHRVFHEFDYDPRATTVTTPVDEVLQSRRGVCQDFAHLTIACLRSIGLPARYVSGYLRSRDGAVGAEASHAWLSVYCPNSGWVDLDPTNNAIANGHHVTIAWGRDYSDVTPMKGVALGGGDQIIDVTVEVVEAR